MHSLTHKVSYLSNLQNFPTAMDVKCFLFFRLLTALILHHLFAASAAAGTNISTDQSALLSLKAHITSDPHGALQSWNVQSPVCNWTGVKCGKRHHRVIGLDIYNLGLSGSIPPALGNLSFLVSIDISSNNFIRVLPEDLARLRRLRFFDLGQNNFIGSVPSWFSSFPWLQYLHLSYNNFTSLNSFILSCTNKSNLIDLDVSFNRFQDEIPGSIGNLENLKALVMTGNRFSGFIPLSIMNISSLETLKLANNSIEGIIPAEAIRNLHNLRVLDIQYNNLGGFIPSSIFNISTLEIIALTKNALLGTLPNDICHQPLALKGLYLSFNQISGHIPSNFSLCSELQILSLSYNIISRTIPGDIGNLEKLERLALGGNKLTGQVPSQLGNLHNLQVLGIERNLLTGSIPITIFNISLLQELYLSENELSGLVSYELGNLTMLRELALDTNKLTGLIPPIFDKLAKLELLHLGMNTFSGLIPSSIFNISTLEVISLMGNSFSGNLPTNIGSFLPSLEKLLLSQNNLHGVLPNSISNASQLMILSLPGNKFSGSIPDSLGDLKFLKYLVLTKNNFTITTESTSSEGSFIAKLTSARNLKALEISYNLLNGILPLSLGNFSSSLQYFAAAACNIKGYIPSEIGNLSGLVTLELGDNYLVGMIPSRLNKLSNLQRFRFGNNRLTGFIPNSLCSLQNLGYISLSQNQLTGSIPKCLGNISSLRYLYLNSNNFTSGLPATVWNLQDLLAFDISLNSITGSLSAQIGNLKAAATIDVSMNLFSNDIPTTIGDLQTVSWLSLAHNRFQGVIPASMGNMLNLASLDLSHNMLSGTIPKSLESLTQLVYFNVSFNKLSGEIPSNGSFRNFTSQSFASNAALCGLSRFQVPPCKESMHRSKRKKMFRTMLIVLGIGSLMLIGTMAFLLVKYCRKKKTPTGIDTLEPTRPQRISYYALLKATNGYSEGNLLGKGSLGSVYKGIFEDGNAFAIKVFNMLQEVASNAFDAECEALQNLRHRNLIAVITSCSNPEFKAIILEYMPNGSLEKWLYSENYFLDMMQRLNIIIDVANALEYLHHGYLTPVIHCDLKPSNVLMDENMVAHVSDFGITKFLGEEESGIHTRTLATLGYMAPEYGLEGRVSTRCDVYSYGILVLETFTRKRPSDEMFCDGINLKNWVKESLSNALDAHLINPEETQTSFNAKYHCALSVLELALRCCEDSPGARMNMKDVVVQLKKIKAKFAERNEGTSELQ